MDEMDQYRERIERRVNGRRNKTDRRRPTEKSSEAMDPLLLIDLLLLLAAGLFMYFTN